jgi:iron complex outermembrane receptor protein
MHIRDRRLKRRAWSFVNKGWRSSTALGALILPAVSLAGLSPAAAQTRVEGSTRSTPETLPTSETDIIVTARKRSETSIAVPVAISAVGGAELSRRAVSSIDALARIVPSLTVGNGGGAAQGGIVSIRGLAGADGNPLGDQAVSFNLDGVQVASANVRRMGQMDLEQVEVLKGPQALFFGKNSPAGVISIRTGNPTPNFTARLSSGYEFHSDETRTEGFISGPVTDTLGVRLAGYFSRIRGDIRNVTPKSGLGIFGPAHDRAPYAREYAVRGTVRWEPTDRFSALIKTTYNRLRGDSPLANVQIVACPLGLPQGSGPLEDCKANGTVAIGDLGPNFGLLDPRFGDGSSFLNQDQLLIGADLKYDLTDTLSLKSVTGFYDVDTNTVFNATANYLETGVPPKTLIAATFRLKQRQFSQEVRLETDFRGPANFLLGGLYSDSRGSYAAVGFRNAFAPGTKSASGGFVNLTSNTFSEQIGSTYSIFGQAKVNVIPTLELSVGARHSNETKSLPVYRSGGPGGTATQPFILVEVDGFPRSVRFNNLSPEATISYRPTSRLTIYASYKEGFLSGGFNGVVPQVTTPSPLASTGRYVTSLDPRYNPQNTRGFEGGVKALLFSGSLRVNLNVYDYKTTGLQVAVNTQPGQQELRNAASVRTRGFELDGSFSPVAGLNITGALNYNDGKYGDYQASCYRGQPSTTCFLQFNRVTGLTSLLQDLSGTRLVRAPLWAGNVGFNYEASLGGDLRFGLSGNVSHSGKFLTSTTSAPGSLQKAYNIYDAGLRVFPDDSRWEAALIGRNLTNTRYFVRTLDNPFSGSAAGGPAATSVLADTAGPVSRGREIMIRFTYSFGG